MILGKIKKVHFIGIGGIGMSGISELLLNLGFKVSGSDIKITPITSQLSKKGAIIWEGHNKKNILDSDLVVYSSAIDDENVELVEARKIQLPIVRRAEMLGELLKLKNTSIAVSGTHGKTSTTSMMGSILTEALFDPTLIIGGVVKNLNANALLGKGDIIVAEADEFDKSFLQLSPTHSIITNIDSDHLDCYGSKENLVKAFNEFANSTAFYGSIILCVDDSLLKSIIPNISRPIITYGFSGDAEFQAVNRKFRDYYSFFDVKHKGEFLGSIELEVPGAHNIKNALATIALSIELGIKFKEIKKGLKNFSGVKRRFEIKGEVNKIIVIDDYAHHPTEVSATLKAIQNGWGEKRIIAIFQPHLFSRTKDFFEDFARSLMISDILIITEIYGAREKPISGVSGELISNVAKSIGHESVYWIKDKNKISNKIFSIVKENDILITMGAGDIYKISDEILNELKKDYVRN